MILQPGQTEYDDMTDNTANELEIEKENIFTLLYMSTL
jgi:hypothetical protein